MRYVEFEVDGKSKKLRFDFNAIADLEQQAGSGVVNLFSEERVGFNTIRLLLWAGLRWEDKGLTTDRAGTIIKQMIEEGQTLEDLSELISKALKLSGLFGDKSKDSGGEEKPPFVETGQVPSKKLHNSKR